MNNLFVFIIVIYGTYLSLILAYLFFDWLHFEYSVNKKITKLTAKRRIINTREYNICHLLEENNRLKETIKIYDHNLQNLLSENKKFRKAISIIY